MDLSPLLAPRSVAVVGANDTPGSYADAVLRNLDRAGFEGPVWGVNPNRGEVHGRECVPSVAELPQPVDAVVIAVPAAAVPEIVREAGSRGCGGAIVLSAGFGEVEAGRGLEAELAAAAREGSLPLCGPNGNGIVAVASRAPLWGDSVQPLEPGRVAMVSQSGNVAVNAIGSRRGIDWHTIVSTGNQTVLAASAWLEAIAELDGVGSVALFLESGDDGPALCESLARCAERGVGIAVLKIGSSDAGAQAAAAHTGSLAGDQRVFRALVEEAGGAWASNPHELLELARVLAEPRARPTGTGGVAVLTCSGGDSGLAADVGEERDLVLPELGAPTRQRLTELLPDAATVTNPLDYTAMIWGDAELLRRIVVAVGDDPGVDQLLLFYDHPRDLAPESDASWAAVRAGLAAGALECDAAALFASTLPDLVDEEAIREVARSGVPTVLGIETAIACAAALRAPAADPQRLREIGAVAERVRVDGPEAADGDGWIGEAAAKTLLRGAGVAIPAGRVAASEEECASAAAELGFPLVMKLSGSGIQHKSEIGAIEIGIGDEPAARAAFERLRAIPSANGAEVLVEQQAGPGVELVVAARADGVIPALVLGLGGIWTEALDDVAVVPLPASPERVVRALRSLRGAALLTGARGDTPVDLKALGTLASRVGDLLVAEDLALLELNPVAASHDGAVALDAIARR